MSRDEGNLPKTELAFEMRKCASCGAKADATDVYCAECGAELPPVASSASASVVAEPVSDQVFAVLAAFIPCDALRGLFVGFPGMVKDCDLFPKVAKRLFAQDVKRYTRYVAVQKSGVMLRLVGQSRVNADDWERVVSDLAEVCGFSREVSVECASEWAYALNVLYPEDPVVEATPPSPVVAPPSAVVSPDEQVRGRAENTEPDYHSSSGRGRVPSAADECLSLTLPGNVSMEFVWCRPGTFTMGSPEGELGRSKGEVQHEVTLSHGFLMACYPTSQLQYEALMGSNPSQFKRDNRPVEMVSWDDAVAFCEQVNSRLGSALPEGVRCTLPTEAQWEYACRAGTTSALNSGYELTHEYGNCPNLNAVAWYDENSGNETHVVGGRQANAWGLYDMLGNVCEWCRDWYDDYPTGRVTDPVGPENGHGCVIRGGSYCREPRFCRSAFRGMLDPSGRNDDVGFRPVLVGYVEGGHAGNASMGGE